jgi:epoxyqueuosine reductase
MTLQEELITCLKQAGAVLIGIADLSDVKLLGEHPETTAVYQALVNEHMTTGISVAIPLPPAIVENVKKAPAPTKAYYDTYCQLNQQLNTIIRTGEQFLIRHGYLAFANTTDKVKKDQNSISALPHKLTATRAGLGWIGKSCLLVTPQYGGAVRISTLLTNAPLQPGIPYKKSRCGACTRCVEICPGQALKGTLWEEGMDRSRILDWEKCRSTQPKRMIPGTGRYQDFLCGKCFAVCPFTQHYLLTSRP